MADPVYRLKLKDEPMHSTQLRLPASLHEALRQAATDNLRSLNNEMLWRLMQSLKEVQK
jgi:hypothetical protein